MFSAVISEQFSKNRMIISVVAAKIRYLKMCGFYWATLYVLNHLGQLSLLLMYNNLTESVGRQSQPLDQLCCLLQPAS